VTHKAFSLELPRVFSTRSVHFPFLSLFSPYTCFPFEDFFFCCGRAIFVILPFLLVPMGDHSPGFFLILRFAFWGGGVIFCAHSPPPPAFLSFFYLSKQLQFLFVSQPAPLHSFFRGLEPRPPSSRLIFQFFFFPHSPFVPPSYS